MVCKIPLVGLCCTNNRGRARFQNGITKDRRAGKGDWTAQIRGWYTYSLIVPSDDRNDILFHQNAITLSALIPFHGASEGQSTFTPISTEETQRIDKDFMRWRKEWVDRRKVYKESVYDCVLSCHIFKGANTKILALLAS